MATENVKVIKVDTGEAQTSVKDLRNQLKELRNTLLSTEQGTKEYNDALQQAADIQHTLKEQMEEINASAMDFGQIVSNATKVVGSMVAGFQAAKATMNLFGVENEEVIKSLQKMQSLMAITQALPAIDDGIKAFDRLSDRILAVVNKLTEKTVAEEVDTVATNANTTAMEANATATNVATTATNKWKKALVSTGLGAILLALGYLVTHFEEISKWLDEVTGQTDFLGELSDKVIGGLNAGWAAIVQSLKAVGNAIVTYVTTPFKAVWNAIQAYTSTKGGFAEKLKAAGAAMKNGFVSDWKKVGDDFKEVGAVAAAAYQSGYEKHKAKRLAKNVEDAVTEGKAEGKAKGEAKAEAEEAAYKKRLKEVDKQEREEMLKLQAMGLNYEEYVAKKEELENEFTKKRIEALQNILATEKELTEEEVSTLQDELIKLQDSLYKKPDKSEESSSATSNPEALTAKQISEAINASALALNDFSDNPAWGNILKNIATLTANWDNLNEQIKEGGNKAFSAYAQIAAAGLGAVATMLNGLAAEQDTSNKEGFESQKKLQTAGATMSMLAGITSAWASSMQLGPIAGPIMGAILSAMMLGTGIAQITKIKNTKFDDKGSIGGASPNTGAVASVIAPVQYTRDVDNASIEGAIKNQKVYVTETDITDTQNKVSVTENEARY